MSKPQHMTAVLLGVAPTAGYPVPGVAVTEPSETVGCKIKATPHLGGVVLEALVSARTMVSGAYNLIVTTGGEGGVSKIVRGSGFNTIAGAEITLNKVDLNLPVGSSYTAALTLEWTPNAAYA